MLGTQEIIALLLVALVVGWAIYRRSRRRGRHCGDCPSSPQTPKAEQTLRFHPRKDRAAEKK